MRPNHFRLGATIYLGPVRCLVGRERGRVVEAGSSVRRLGWSASALYTLLIHCRQTSCIIFCTYIANCCDRIYITLAAFEGSVPDSLSLLLNAILYTKPFRFLCIYVYTYRGGVACI